MIIINADDWGRSEAETDAALSCFRQGRITSVSAMVFMKDSERAAALAREHKLDVGLHLNLSQRYQSQVSPAATESHKRIIRFLTFSKYALLLYHPGLRRDFREVYQVQITEFLRLYGKAPSHIDGHQHKHLCMNALIDGFIPPGHKVRRSFSFWPGEKGLVNRLYRRQVDKCLGRKYCLTNYFFSLGQCLQEGRLGRVAELARTTNVELMTHPQKTEEKTWLMSDACLTLRADIRSGTYTMLRAELDSARLVGAHASP
jgi:hypothetical protein